MPRSVLLCPSRQASQPNTAGCRAAIETHHNSLVDPVPKYLDKYFGQKCESKVGTMSAVDAQGIRAGAALVGMTKPGVILAIGYPPEHATPTLESNSWMYWKARFGKRQIQFTDGKVTGIRD